MLDLTDLIQTVPGMDLTDVVVEVVTVMEVEMVMEVEEVGDAEVVLEALEVLEGLGVWVELDLRGRTLTVYGRGTLNFEIV